MSTESHIWCSTDSHRRRTVFGFDWLNWLFIQLYRFYDSYFQIIFIRNTKWSSNFQHTGLHVHTNDDWVRPIEDSIWNDFQSAWENSVFTSCINALFLAFFNVCSKLIEQVIYNFSLKYFNALLFCLSFCFRCYPYIKRKNATKLLLDFARIFIYKSFLSFQNIILMNWTDSNRDNWNFTSSQEFKQCFQWT